MRKELIIFDCDGVLVDSWEATMYLYNEVCAAMGRHALTPEEKAFVYVATLPQGFARLLGEERAGEALERVASFSTRDVVARIRPAKGVHRALERLRESGVLLAVCTNGGREQHVVLESHGLNGFFQRVVTSDDVTLPKPDPEGLQLILEEMGVSRDRAVFVGDSLSDGTTARNAGMEFWAFASPELEADLHLPDFGSLAGHCTESVTDGRA